MNPNAQAPNTVIILHHQNYSDPKDNMPTSYDVLQREDTRLQGDLRLYNTSCELAELCSRILAVEFGVPFAVLGSEDFNHSSRLPDRMQRFQRLMMTAQRRKIPVYLLSRGRFPNQLLMPVDVHHMALGGYSPMLVKGYFTSLQ